MNNIKKLRKGKHMTQIELAKLCNITQGTLSSYENERYEPDMTTLKILADIFEVSVDEILGRTPGEKVAPPFPSAVLSQDELTLLERYRALSDDDKELLRSDALRLKREADRGAGNAAQTAG